MAHPDIDAFLHDLWEFPVAISTELFIAWESDHPHLVNAGLGDEFSDDFQSALNKRQISGRDFRHIIESLVEIVFSSFYGASQDQQSLDDLYKVINATAPFGVSPPPPDLFSKSLFVDNHGWGKPLSSAERDEWRFANY